MRICLLSILFFASFNSFAKESKCIVISGLKRDTNSAFWEFKNKELYKGCSVYTSFKEFEQTHPQNSILDIRVISHGKKDGTVLCDAGDETPTDIINTINKIGKNNKTFISLDSCYSEQVLKEKIIQDNNQNRLTKSIQNTCLYAASAPKRETYIDEITFADLHFKNDKPLKNISVLDLYKQTQAGVISAAPYNEAGIGDYWSGGNLQVATKNLLSLVDEMMTDAGTLPAYKCQTFYLVSKLSPENFSTLALSIQKMKNAENMFKFSADQWRKLMSSFERLTEKEGTKELFTRWVNEGPDEVYFSEIYKTCSQYAPEEAYCQRIMSKGKDSYSVDMIFEQRKLAKLLQEISPNKVDPLQYVKSDQFLSAFISETNHKKNNFNQNSFLAVMGVDPQNSKIEAVSLPESDKVNWSGYLGAFNRLSLNGDPSQWKNKKDKARYKACAQFYYDQDGKLQAK